VLGGLEGCVDAWPGWVGALPAGVASNVVQYAATLSLPPAVSISTVNAGLSSALPGLSPTAAWKAVHSPRRFGEGEPLGAALPDPAALRALFAVADPDAGALLVALEAGRAVACSFDEPAPGR
jgi:hypothetical protein